MMELKVLIYQKQLIKIYLQSKNDILMQLDRIENKITTDKNNTKNEFGMTERLTLKLNEIN